MGMGKFEDAPKELQDGIAEFWPSTEWDNAAAVAELESGWSAFSVADTRSQEHPCGSVLSSHGGVHVAAEYSIGWFQINACNLPADWVPENLFNTRHNCGTAHALWVERGWQPWFFSATKLGLI